MCSPGKHSETCKSFADAQLHGKLNTCLCLILTRFSGTQHQCFTAAAQAQGTLLPRRLGYQLEEISPVPGGVLQTPQQHTARSRSSHQMVPPELMLRPSLQSSSGDNQPPLRLPKPVLSPSKRHQGVGNKYWDRHGGTFTAPLPWLKSNSIMTATHRWTTTWSPLSLNREHQRSRFLEMRQVFLAILQAGLGCPQTLAHQWGSPASAVGHHSPPANSLHLSRAEDN